MKFRVETGARSLYFFFLPCSIYFMFALVRSDAKKISTWTTLRQKSVEALVNINNSFRTFPHVVNSSFHIFPRSSSLGLGSEWSCQEAWPSPDSGPALPKCSFRCGNEWGAGDSASLARLVLRLSQRKTCSPGPFLASRATPASDAFSDLSLYLPGLHRLPHSPTPALSSVWFAGSADPSLTWRHGQPCSVPPCFHPRRSEPGPPERVPWVWVCAFCVRTGGSKHFLQRARE